MFVEPARLPAAALNGFIGALTVVYSYRMALILIPSHLAERVGTWLCVFPSFLMWSAQTIKEPVVILLEVMVIYNCLGLRAHGFSIKRLAGTTACIVMLIPFRFYAAYLALATTLITTFSLIMKSHRSSFGSRFISAAGLIGIGAFLVTSGLLAGRETHFERFDLEYISKMKSYDLRTSGSSVSMDLDLHTTGGMGLSLLIGGAHLLLSPFPWQLVSGSTRMLIVAPEMVFWWWLVAAGGIRGFRYMVRYRFVDILPVLTMLFGLGILYSLMFTNVGLIYRQRSQLLPFLMIFATVGLELKKQGTLAPLRI